MGKICAPCTEMIIKSVGVSSHEKLYKGAECAGITMNALVKPLLKKIIEFYPTFMREEKAPDIKRKRLSLRGMSKDTKTQLQNIASHIGVDVGDLVKVELGRQSYPTRNIIGE